MSAVARAEAHPAEHSLDNLEIRHSLEDRYRRQLLPGETFTMLNRAHVDAMLDEGTIPDEIRQRLLARQERLERTAAAANAWRAFRETVIATHYGHLNEPKAVRFLQLMNPQGEALTSSPLAFPLALKDLESEITGPDPLDLARPIARIRELYRHSR